MSRNGAIWGQISWGILFAGFGVFLLLTTLGIIPATFWLALLPFWPVLLIAIGLRFIFERSGVPALSASNVPLVSFRFQ